MPALGQLQPPPAPPQNQFSEAKRILGKILFWDEQLSMTNTVACATCHLPQNGGSDPRAFFSPGPDNVFGNADDRRGSAGVAKSSAFMDFMTDVRFGIGPQVTERAAPSMINAVFSPAAQFWDGRASGQFVNPINGQVVIPQGGALESQAVGPPVNSVEMAHDGVSWSEVTIKLAQVKPMELAFSVTPDMAAVLTPGVDYPALFQQAFGDPAINPVRIAFAIATYERTLIADDTPWDRTQRGLPGGLSAAAQRGFNAFQAPQSRCNVCHTPPVFSNNTFRNIGIRPPAEDTGRQVVTGNPGDRGRFKVPILRNVGLRSTHMHNGQFTNLTDVVRFYARAPGAAPQFGDNLDPVVIGIAIPPNAQADIEEFLRTGLTDARVRDSVFPFDRATLTSQRPERLNLFMGGGQAGAGGQTPRILADMPSLLGSNIRVGMDRALAGATARLAVSRTEPVGGKITPTGFLGEVVVGADGMATLHFELDPRDFTDGLIYLQWQVDDPSAVDGVAMSTVARTLVFCGRSGCAVPCIADFTDDGDVNSTDFFEYLQAFFAGDASANVNGDTVVNSSDFFVFLDLFFTGC